MQKVHTFVNSLKVGALGEQILDSHFTSKFNIEEVDMAAQRRGIDRIFTHKESGAVCTVEYKTDTRAADTGNVFLEIWSNKEKEKRGWAYTSQARWLYFYMPGLEKVCIMEMTKLKMAIREWTDSKDYRRVKVRNPSYTTEGILMPVVEFEELCYETITIGVRKDDK